MLLGNDAVYISSGGADQGMESGRFVGWVGGVGCVAGDGRDVEVQKRSGRGWRHMPGAPLLGYNTNNNNKNNNNDDDDGNNGNNGNNNTNI